jgi:hypothetical protein
MKALRLTAAGFVITIFWAMLSLIFESVVWQHRSGWEWLPWWTCDLVASVGGVASFIYVTLREKGK